MNTRTIISFRRDGISRGNIALRVVAVMLQTVAAACAFGGVVSIIETADSGAPGLKVEAAGRRLEFRRDAEAVFLYDVGGEADRCIAGLAPARGVELAEWRIEASSENAARVAAVFKHKSGKGTAGIVFAMREDGAVELRPQAGEAVVEADVAYGILPSRHLDDVVFMAEDWNSAVPTMVTDEGVFMGLLKGGNRVLVFAWTPGENRVCLQKNSAGTPAIAFTGHDLVLWIKDFQAAGIWSEIELNATFEEKYTPLTWTPPFEAQWKTQLAEHGVPTTFKLSAGRKSPWRPGVGKFVYPFVRDGDKVELYLYKELASSGKALIYALEGYEKTPYSFLVSVLPAQTLREMRELEPVFHYSALDPERTPNGRVSDGATMDLWCGGRDFLKTSSFETGAFAGEQEFLDQVVAERQRHLRAVFVFYFQRLVETLDALDELTRRWEAEAAGNEARVKALAPFRAALDEMSRMCRGRMGGLTPQGIIEKAESAAGAFSAAIRDGSGIEAYPEILYYFDELNSLLYIEEAAGQRSGTYGRALFQKAGRVPAEASELMPYLKQVRELLRRFMQYRSNYELPTPSGYSLPAGHVFAAGLFEKE